MTRITASNFIAHRLFVLPLIVLLLSSCLQEQPSGIEGTGGHNPPPPPPPQQGGLSMTTARAEHTATLLRDGRVLIAGGFDGSLHALASAELYDPTSGTFARTGDMTQARGSHTAILLANGNVLIAGGLTETPHALGIGLDSADIYDPSTETFTATGKMITPFYGWGVSTLLPDGRVLIATDNSASNAEIYDPASGSFMLTGAYASTSYVTYATALLPDGRVLVVGVVDSAGPAGTAQLFDPKTNTFSSTGQRACPDCVSTATLLPNGQVLFVEAGDGVSDFAEIYDPASGTFINFGRTPDSQVFSTATRLSDGVNCRRPIAWERYPGRESRRRTLYPGDRYVCSGSELKNRSVLSHSHITPRWHCVVRRWLQRLGPTDHQRGNL
jgi:hypothetical protein